MPKQELIDAAARIIEPALFQDYQHAGPLHEIEKMAKARAEFIETTRAKAREILALV